MDLDIRRTRTCEKCRAVVTLDKVRLFPKSKDKSLLVCDKCVEELKQNRGLEKQPITNTPKNPGMPTPEYASYFCGRCNYSFRVDKVKAGVLHNLLCPYCGKADRLSKVQVPK